MDNSAINFSMTVMQSRRPKISDPIKRLTDIISNIEIIKEAERKKFSREIHDGIGGNMAAIKMVVDSTLILAQKNPHLIVDKLLYLQNIVDLTLKETRRISNDLRSELIDLGLENAIKIKTTELENQSGIFTEFHSNKTTERLSERKETSLYRSCEELLNYFQQQTDVTKLKITFTYNEGTLAIQFADNINTHHMMNPSKFKKIEARMSTLGGYFSMQKNLKEDGWLTTIELMITQEERQPLTRRKKSRIPS
jgi:signal transduction histidine kinase